MIPEDIRELEHSVMVFVIGTDIKGTVVTEKYSTVYG